MMSRMSARICRVNIHERLRIGLACLAMVSILTGCSSESGHSRPQSMSSSGAVNLDGELVRASNLGKPLIIMVIESGQSRADSAARSLVKVASAKSRNDGILFALLDISISRNRATAMRFHVTNTPALFCLSAKGLIVSRDEAPIDRTLLSRRIEEVAQKSPELDAKLDLLTQSVNRNPDGVQAQLDLAEFLLERQNAREAIPHLEAVAHNEAADTTVRVHAWVDLVLAHFWISEPEKGRHEANDLIALLGPKTAEARAGGNLVLGIQDVNAKRMALARRELEAAIAAAPNSGYAKQAAEALAKLPGEAE